MKIHKTKSLTILIFLAMLTTEAFAVDTQMAAISEEDFLADIPVVLTATRLAQPINEAPAAMTIIDRQMIEASGAREIAELFKLVPGFQVNHENGHTPIVTYNGLSDQFSRRMQVLVDGRSVYTPILGGADWAQLPLTMDDIERIEVTRGPNAASYGANAFLAIINIITRHASETTGFFGRYTTGSHSIKDGVLRYGNTTGDLDYRLTLGYSSDDAFALPPDDMKLHNALFRGDYVTGMKDTVTVQAGYSDATRGVYSDSKQPYPTFDKQGIDRFQQIRWTHEIDSAQNLQIQYYHNDHTINEKWVILNDTPWVDALADLGITGLDVQSDLDISHHSQRHDLEVQHTYVPNKSWRIAWGGSLRREFFDAPELTRDDARSHADLKRLFANGEWRADEHWLFNAGAMWEDNVFSGRDISPRAAIHFKADNHHTLRLVASKATRTPTLIEEEDEVSVHLSGPAIDALDMAFPGLFPHDILLYRSEKNVDAEKITSLEIGYNAAYPGAGINLDIKLFKNHVDELINLVRRTDPATGFKYSIQDNVDDATVRGIEAYLDIKTANRVRAIFSYAYTRIISDDVYQQYSETMPLHNVSILLSKEFADNINASLAFYRVTLAEGLGTGNPVPPHNRADFRIAFPFRVQGVRGDFAFVTQNFLDEYTDWRNENIFDSRHYVTMTAHF